MNRLSVVAGLAFLGMATSVSAAPRRCDPVEAKQNYICKAYLNCSSLKIDPYKIDSYSDAELLQKLDDVMEATVKSPPPGKTFYPALLAYEMELGHHAILAARHVIVDFQSAPISDYQCQASITFNEPALQDVLPWVIYEVLLQSNQNVLIMAMASKEPQKAVQYMRTMIAVLQLKAAQCIVHNPVFTSGLPFTPDQLFTPGCATP
jgi:hypothetical protein